MRFRHASSVRVLLMGLTLCVLSLSRPAQAQIGFGLIGGANFSSLNSIQANGNLVSFDNASSFHAGVFLDIQLGPLGIRPSVLYLDAGSLFQGATFLNQDDFKLSYISIPVDLLFTMGVGPLKPYLFAGPEFRLLNSTTAPIDLEENLETFIMGASAGVGLALRLPGAGLKLYPQIRYSFGLSELTQDTYQVNGISILTEGDSKVNSWLLSLGVGF